MPLLPLGLGGFCFCFLFLWFLRTHQLTGDSVNNLSGIRSVRVPWSLYHPHHLLYGPLVCCIYQVLRGLRLTADVEAVSQGINAVSASLTVVTLVLLLRRRRNFAYHHVLLPVLLLCSYGLIYYVAQSEAYVVANTFLILLLYTLVRLQDTGRSRYAWLAGAWLAIAVLLMQAHVILTVPFVVFFLAAMGRGRTKLLAGVLLAAGALVLAIYLAMTISFLPGIGLPVTPRVIWTAFSYYGTLPMPNWGTFDNYSRGGVQALLATQVLGVAKVSTPGSVLALAGGLLLALVAYHVRALCKRTTERTDVPLRLYLLSWMGVHLLFYLWWLPSEADFALPMTVAVVILLAVTLDDLGRRVPAGRLSAPVPLVLTTACLVLGTVNVATFRKLRDTDSPSKQAADELLSLQREHGCCIVTSYTVSSMLSYYYHVPMETMTEFKKAIFATYLAAPPGLADGQPVYERSSCQCLLAPTEFLRPGYLPGDWPDEPSLETRFLKTYSGDKYPQAWFSFSKRLLGYRDTQPPTMSRLALAHRGQHEYVVIRGGERIPLADDLELLAVLERLLAGQHGAGPGPLGYDKVRAALATPLRAL